MKRDLTIPQLEHLLQRKRAVLVRLLHKRAAILRQIRDIDRHMASPETCRERPKPIHPNPKPLCSVVVQILRSHPDGLTAADLAPAILATGYKTNSRDFPALIKGSISSCTEVKFDHKAKRYKLRG